MNKYLALLCLLLVGCLLLMVGLNMIVGSNDQQAAENDKSIIGSEAWCDAMVDKPNPEWTERSTQDFSRYCLYD